jgi:hypothetical protein
MNTCHDSFKKKNSFITGQKQLMNNINIEEKKKKNNSKQKVLIKSFSEKFNVKNNAFPTLSLSASNTKKK